MAKEAYQRIPENPLNYIKAVLGQLRIASKRYGAKFLTIEQILENGSGSVRIKPDELRLYYELAKQSGYVEQDGQSYGITPAGSSLLCGQLFSKNNFILNESPNARAESRRRYFDTKAAVGTMPPRF